MQQQHDAITFKGSSPFVLFVASVLIATPQPKFIIFSGALAFQIRSQIILSLEPQEEDDVRVLHSTSV